MKKIQFLSWKKVIFFYNSIWLFPEDILPNWLIKFHPGCLLIRLSYIYFLILKGRICFTFLSAHIVLKILYMCKSNWKSFFRNPLKLKYFSLQPNPVISKISFLIKCFHNFPWKLFLVHLKRFETILLLSLHTMFIGIPCTIASK